MCEKGYYIYKYVYNNDIIYIGKSDSSIINRINCHSREEKFQPYLNSCKIFYFECKNNAETTIMECYLINKYKPILNVSMKYSDDLSINITEPKWLIYNPKSFRPKYSLVKKESWRQRKPSESEIIKQKIILCCAYMNDLNKFMLCESFASWYWEAALEQYDDPRGKEIILSEEWLGKELKESGINDFDIVKYQYQIYNSLDNLILEAYPHNLVVYYCVWIDKDNHCVHFTYNNNLPNNYYELIKVQSEKRYNKCENEYNKYEQKYEQLKMALTQTQ